MEVLHWIPEIPIVWIPFFPEFESTVLSEDDDYKMLINRYGITMKVLKKTESMPQFLDFPVKDRKDWEGLKHRLNPDNPDRYSILENIEADFNARKGIPRGEEICPFPICGGYGTCRNLFGEEKLAYMLHDDPELIHEIMDTWLRFYCGFADRINLEFDFIYIWDDMAYKNGPLISPHMVGEFLVPYYRELIQHYSRLGYKVFMWGSDGDPRKILPLMVEAGVNTFIPCEINSGVEPLELQMQYGRNLSLCGGIDKKALVRNEADIYEEVMRKVPDLLINGGYVPAVDHGVPPDVPFENFSYFIDLVRRLGREIQPDW